MSQDATNWTVRRAVPSDVEALVGLQWEGWSRDYVDYVPAGYGEMAMKQYGDTAVIAQEIQTATDYWVAEQAGQLWGTLCGANLNEHEAEIWWLHVAGLARGRGVGCGLIAHYISQLSPAIEWVYVTTFAGYTPTIRFYERVGFVPYAHIPRTFNGVAFQDLRLRMPATAVGKR